MNVSASPRAPTTASRPAPLRTGAWFFSKIRQGHGWLGIGASLLIMTVCLSGLYLNHKDWFDSWPRLNSGTATLGQFASLFGDRILSDAALTPIRNATFSGRLATGVPPAALQSGIAQALGEARKRWGDTELERIEFKGERGSLLCKLTSAAKQQMTLDLRNGRVTLKAAQSKPEKSEAAGKSSKQGGLGKFIKDLHTGQMGGLAGKLLVDFASLSVLTLTWTGLYLWAWPRLRQRRAGSAPT